MKSTTQTKENLLPLWFQELQMRAYGGGPRLHLLPGIGEGAVLINWPKGGGSCHDKGAFRWGIGNGLKKSPAYILQDIDLIFPKLNLELNEEQIYLIETTGHTTENGERKTWVLCMGKKESKFFSRDRFWFTGRLDWEVFLK